MRPGARGVRADQRDRDQRRRGGAGWPPARPATVPEPAERVGVHRRTLTTFVVARTGDIDKLDPQLATAFQTHQTLNLVYSRLVKTSADREIQPDLATKWTTSPDGKTVTFTLRTGVKWQDGSPFTSADVKASIARILDEATGAVARSNLLAIASVDTPDDSRPWYCTCPQPSAALLYSLASVNSSIESAKDIAAGTVGKKPDGTGPFAWKQWDQGQQVVLTANTTTSPARRRSARSSSGSSPTSPRSCRA